MKRILIALILVCVTFPLFGQLTLRDCVGPRAFPARLSQLSWQGDGENYVYVKGSTLMQGDVKGNTTELLTLGKLNKAFEDEDVSLRRFPSMTWEDANTFSFFHQNTHYTYNLGEGTMTEGLSYPEEAENLDIGPNNRVAFTISHNAYIQVAGEDTERQLTTDGSLDLVYGEAAHRSEFGIVKGLFWSNSGRHLAFYRQDQSMVTEYPLIDYMARTATNTPIKYPMAGATSHEVAIGIYDVQTKKTLFLKTEGPADQYLTNTTWSPDDKLVYVAVLNRDQNDMSLNAYDVATGELVKTLFTEKHDKYVEPEHGPIFLPKTQDQFIWYSERDGYNHLYLYNTEGKLLKQLTEGDWIVTDILAIDPSEECLIYTSTEVSPVERHTYRLDLNNGKRKRLTQAKGMHASQVRGDMAYILDAYSNLETPYVQQVVNVKKGKQTASLLEADDPLADENLGEMTLMTLKAEDGHDLHCRLIKPVDFDPNKKYPVMIYVYGGPHVQLVQERYLGAARPFLQYMAQKGYVVFTLDNRGSADRGRTFEQAIFRQCGTAEVADQMVGVNWLKKQSYVDADRMGVYGWSYGGFMTMSMMLRNPGVFKAGVAGGPVIDWKYYEIMYTERYMDTPETNPDGYKTASLLGYVNNLEGQKLLIIHGQQDNVVVPQHTQAFVRKCVENNVLVDYFPYPTHPHNVRGWDRVHLLNKISSYFEENL